MKCLRALPELLCFAVRKPADCLYVNSMDKVNYLCPVLYMHLLSVSACIIHNEQSILWWKCIDLGICSVTLSLPLLEETWLGNEALLLEEEAEAATLWLWQTPLLPRPQNAEDVQNAVSWWLYVWGNIPAGAGSQLSVWLEWGNKAACWCCIEGGVCVFVCVCVCVCMRVCACVYVAISQ